MRKFANFARLYFPHITTYISQPNFGILLVLKGSFREFGFFRLDKKLVYNYSILVYSSFLRSGTHQWHMQISGTEGFCDTLGTLRLTSTANR